MPFSGVLGLSPTPPSGFAAGRQGRRPKGRTSTAQSQQSTAQFCQVRAARSGGGPKTQRACPATLKDRNSFTQPTARLSPHSVGFVFGRSQRRTNIKAEAASKRRCASPPHPGAAGRPLSRGLSYSLSSQIPAQSKAQFSAPCRPHCGSASAPPRFRAPARFNYFGSPPK